MPGEIDLSRLPEHIAIIMDGNGRWAQKRGLPRVIGHKAGMEAIRKTVKYCSDIGIKILTVFAFSTENWKRPHKEIMQLFRIFTNIIREELPELKEDENGIVAGPKKYIFDITKRWMDPNSDGKSDDGIDGWRLDVAYCVKHPFWKDWRKWQMRVGIWLILGKD